ncbi:MAG: type IV secretion system DNA-binding domain-containing protein [Gallionella sp.]
MMKIPTGLKNIFSGAMGKDSDTKQLKPYMYAHPDFGMSKEDWARHMMIYGGLGSGKTFILLQMLDQIFQKNEKLILYDIKGDMTRKFPEALLMSPWDQRSVVWDIAQDIDTESAIRAFANSLFPTNNDDKNKYFQEAAADIMIAIIKEMYVEHKGNWGWQHLNKAAARSCEEQYASMVRFNPEQAKVIAAILETFSAGIHVVNQLATAWGDGNTNERFSFKQWLQDDYQGKRQIILQGGLTFMENTYISAIVNSLIPQILSPSFEDNELGRSLFFVFDEFHTLGKIEIDKLIALGRSKGCIVILGLQDIAQVKVIYGEEFSRTLPAIVGTQIVCRVGPGETRQMVHQLIGKKRVGRKLFRKLLNESDLTTMLGPQGSSSRRSIRSIILSGERRQMLDWSI